MLTVSKIRCVGFRLLTYCLRVVTRTFDTKVAEFFIENKWVRNSI